MTRHEQVVVALGVVGITHQAAFGANSLNLRIAPRDEFVGINLMARVPNQTIVREIKRLMQCQTKFHHAQVRCEMGAAITHEVAKHLAHFVREPFQLWQAQPLQIGRGSDRG